MKNKKTVIAIAVVVLFLAAGGAAAFAIIHNMSGRKSVSESISLGEKYFSEEKYDSALEEYSAVLKIDPKNQQAVVGVAKCYNATGDADAAKDIIEEEIDDNSSEEMLSLYADILDGNGDYGKEISVVKKLIEKYDRDEYYQKYNELSDKGFTRISHSYGENDYVTAKVENSKVYTYGDNILGALGTDVNIGADKVTTDYADAGFTGNAQSVYVLPSNTAVIDTDGHLWIAGSNRSGQKQDDTVTFTPDAGWTQASITQKVISAAGFSGSIVALTEDGSLYYKGMNMGYEAGPAWAEDWTQITCVGTVKKMEQEQGGITVLNDKGDVYFLNDQYFVRDDCTVANWYLQLSGLSDYSTSENDIVGVTPEGYIYTQYYNITFPDEWVDNATGYGIIAPFDIISIAAMSNGVYFLDDDYNLYYVSQGNSTMISDASDAVSKYGGNITGIYSERNHLVIELDNGNAFVAEEGFAKK